MPRLSLWVVGITIVGLLAPGVLVYALMPGPGGLTAAVLLEVIVLRSFWDQVVRRKS